MIMVKNTMDVLNSLGPNKVVIPIISNEYEETHPIKDHAIGHFDRLDDLIDMYRCSLATHKKANVAQTKQVHQQHPKLNLIQNPSSHVLDGFDSLLLCVLEIIEPTVSLLSSSTKEDKVAKFKIQLASNLSDPAYVKKSTYDKAKMLTYLKEGDVSLCDYLSLLVKKNIVIFTIADETYKTFTKDGINECVIIEKGRDNIYRFLRYGEMEHIQRDIDDKKMAKYVNEGILERLGTMLIKDLKELADDIGVPTTYKTDDNKKKQYLKNDLKEGIKKKFDLYKQ